MHAYSEEQAQKRCDFLNPTPDIACILKGKATKKGVKNLGSAKAKFCAKLATMSQDIIIVAVYRKITIYCKNHHIVAN